PEFTGRICPAPCETACVLGINQPAITIEEIEKHIIEIAFDKGFVQPKKINKRSGKKVAVVGSGPAGLAAAAQLNYAGHTVTVFERDDRPGGLLRYGIPDFKLEKWVVDRRIKLMEEERITFMPWPSYPMTLKTSSSHEEGADRKWAIATKEFIGDGDGNLKALKIVDLEWKITEDGRAASFVEVAGSEREIPCELALLAMGFVNPQYDGLLQQLDVELDERRNIRASEKT